MENASKALIMAGGVLIGVLILSLWAYLFISFGSTAADVRKQAENNKIVQFNNQFTSYEGKEEITIYDVITVAELAKENNDYYKDNTDYLVTVELKDKNNKTNYKIENKNKEDKIDLLKEDQSQINEANSELPHYKCNIEYNSSTGRVNKLIFTYKK